MSQDTLWRISLTVPAAAVEIVEAALAPCCHAIASRLGDPGGTIIEGLASGPIDVARLEIDLVVAAAAAGIALPQVTIEPLAPRNWLAENRETFAAFRIGRFFIHEHDDTALPPAAALPIAVDAGLAFGSGRHASTAGCLRALGALAPRAKALAPGPVLDLGCGSAILAIAAARTLRRPVVATDIDPLAVRVAKENAVANGVAAAVRTLTADGFAHPTLRAQAPYALIFANILARPLQRLARAVVAHTAPGGVIVLAGFVSGDDRRVLAAYTALGCRLERRFVIDGWATLALRHGGRS